MKTKYDYSALLKDAAIEKQPWYELIPQNLSIGQQVIELLKLSVSYPDEIAELNYRIIGTYLMMPSALCVNLPMLLLYGTSGTGKSQVGKFAARLWDCKIFSPADTFAGIRNEVNKRKTHYVESYEEGDYHPRMRECEANVMTIWDDVDPAILKTKPDIFRMMKVGCDRSCSVITLSGGETGSNIKFDCFAPRIFSSISPIHSIPEFLELQRRMFVVHHSKNLAVPIFFDDYDWATLPQQLQGFWDLHSAKAFLEFRRRLNKRRDKENLIDPSRWAILLDYVTTGVICGVWHDVDPAFADIRDFFKYQESHAERCRGNLAALIEDYVRESERNGLDSIFNSNIRAKIKQWDNESMLLDKPVRGEVSGIMRSVGYHLDRGTWIKEN